MIEIDISDTGIGIDESSLKNIYDDFFQGEFFMTKKYSGIGLGLSMTKVLVDNMNGKISILSEKNKGTTVKIMIPIILKPES